MSAPAPEVEVAFGNDIARLYSKYPSQSEVGTVYGRNSYGVDIRAGVDIQLFVCEYRDDVLEIVWRTLDISTEWFPEYVMQCLAYVAIALGTTVIHAPGVPFVDTEYLVRTPNGFKVHSSAITSYAKDFANDTILPGGVGDRKIVARMFSQHTSGGVSYLPFYDTPTELPGGVSAFDYTAPVPALPAMTIKQATGPSDAIVLAHGLDATENYSVLQIRPGTAIEDALRVASSYDIVCVHEDASQETVVSAEAIFDATPAAFACVYDPRRGGYVVRAAHPALPPVPEWVAQEFPPPAPVVPVPAVEPTAPPRVGARVAATQSDSDAPLDTQGSLVVPPRRATAIRPGTYYDLSSVSQMLAADLVAVVTRLATTYAEAATHPGTETIRSALVGLLADFKVDSDAINALPASVGTLSPVPLPTETSVAADAALLDLVGVVLVARDKKHAPAKVVSAVQYYYRRFDAMRSVGPVSDLYAALAGVLVVTTQKNAVTTTPPIRPTSIKTLYAHYTSIWGEEPVLYMMTSDLLVDNLTGKRVTARELGYKLETMAAFLCGEPKVKTTSYAHRLMAVVAPGTAPTLHTPSNGVRTLHELLVSPLVTNSLTTITSKNVAGAIQAMLKKDAPTIEALYKVEEKTTSKMFVSSNLKAPEMYQAWGAGFPPWYYPREKLTKDELAAAIQDPPGINAYEAFKIAGSAVGDVVVLSAAIEAYHANFAQSLPMDTGAGVPGERGAPESSDEDEEPPASSADADFAQPLPMDTGADVPGERDAPESSDEDEVPPASSADVRAPAGLRGVSSRASYDLSNFADTRSLADAVTAVVRLAASYAAEAGRSPRLLGILDEMLADYKVAPSTVDDSTSVFTATRTALFEPCPAADAALLDLVGVVLVSNTRTHILTDVAAAVRYYYARFSAMQGVKTVPAFYEGLVSALKKTVDTRRVTITPVLDDEKTRTITSHFNRMWRRAPTLYMMPSYLVVEGLVAPLKETRSTGKRLEYMAALLCDPTVKPESIKATFANRLMKEVHGPMPPILANYNDITVFHELLLALLKKGSFNKFNNRAVGDLKKMLTSGKYEFLTSLETIAGCVFTTGDPTAAELGLYAKWDPSLAPWYYPQRRLDDELLGKIFVDPAPANSAGDFAAEIEDAEDSYGIQMAVIKYLKSCGVDETA